VNKVYFDEHISWHAFIAWLHCRAVLRAVGRAAVGMGIPIGIPMGMGWVWG